MRLKAFLFYFYFSGVQESESEFIDISSVEPYERDNVRKNFVRSGFAAKRSDKNKLRPCPLGTFVDSSLTDPHCKNCSAGKPLPLTLHKSFD